MPRFLLTNDDGLDSPVLVPLARALSGFGSVRVVVPEGERSWIGKAISRFDTVQVRPVEREGFPVLAVSGTPADCVSLGVSRLLPEPPDLVVSGINLGLNFGTAFLLSSGTVGAACEAWITGVPSVAFSMAIPAAAYGSDGPARAERIRPYLAPAVNVAAEIVATLLAHGFPESVDMITVNLPPDAHEGTPRRVTRVTRARYAPVFRPAGDGDGYVHRFQSYEALEDDPDGDVATVGRGEVSITPLRFEFSARMPSALHAALERAGSARRSAAQS